MSGEKEGSAAPAGEGATTDTAQAVVNGTADTSVQDGALAALQEGMKAAETLSDEYEPTVAKADDAGKEKPAEGDPEKPEGEVETPDDAKGDGDADAAGDGGEKPEPSEADEEIATLGVKNEKAQARFRELWEKSKRADELEGRVREADELIQSFEAIGAAPQQVGAMMGYLNAINRGGPKEWAQAEKSLTEELNWLRQKLGKPVGDDPLATHADLKADVDGGEMTRERALEIAELRGRQKAWDSHTEQTQQAQQAQQQQVQAFETGKQSLNNLELTLKAADPHYAAKREHLVKVLKPVMQALPPDRWAGAFEAAYRELPQTFGQVLPPAQKPAPSAVPLRSQGNGGGSLAREAASPEEALRMGMEAANRGATW